MLPRRIFPARFLPFLNKIAFAAPEKPFSASRLPPAMRPEDPHQGGSDVPEPGLELDARLRRIEQRVREQLAGLGPSAPEEALVRMSSGDVLMLVACVRELLRDREAMLEEIEALECAAAPPRRS